MRKIKKNFFKIETFISELDIETFNDKFEKKIFLYKKINTRKI